MLRSKVEFSWHIREGEWPADDQRIPPFRANLDGVSIALTERRLLWTLLRGALALAVMLTLVAAASPSPQLLVHKQVTEQIGRVIAQEVRALKHDDIDLYEPLVADRQAMMEFEGWFGLWRMRSALRRGLNVEIVSVHLLGEDRAVVDVRITPPVSHWIAAPYQVTRFYVHTPDGWQQTVPPAEYWGEPRSVETENLRVEYFERDGALLLPILDDLEMAHARLIAVLPLSPGRGTDKLTFAVEPRLVSSWRFASMRVTVSSPHLIQIPDAVDPSTSLFDAITSRMVDRALSQALTVTELHNSPEWYLTLNGLSDWLHAYLFELPPDWQVAGENQIVNEGSAYFPFTLSDVKPTSRLREERRLMRDELAHMLVAYAVESYGLSHLPRLLAGMREHDDWAELIPAVYGESSAFFARGWNAYLAERYDLFEE